ncbi:MAG TPA: 30S ribosomal protein S6 [Candidatus Omnitrophota bacterium]|nr:30S ribosomal protein S6 [Candidatus Omnitrophota bacterium]
MNKYEAMMIIRPDLSEEQRKELFSQISEVVSKFEGKVTQADIWSEKRKLYFTIKKHQEGAYYLLNFAAPPLKIKEIRQAYKLNEFILRTLITRRD